LLDSGNFSGDPTASGEIKSRALLEAMQRLGYQVVNVGERDIRMGYPDFAKRTSAFPFTYVSANIVERKTKRPIFSPHAVVEARSQDRESTVKVGVIGVVRFNPVFLKAGPEGSSIVIEHPLERVRAEVAALQKKKVEVVVLLAAMHKNDARSIVREVPGIDFVLGSYGGLISADNEQEGSTTILYCGNRGQLVGESRAFLHKDKGARIASRTNKLHVLTGHYPDDDRMLAFLSRFPRDAPAAEDADPAEYGGEAAGQATPPGS